MEVSITGVITNVEGPKPVLNRETGQPTGAQEVLFRVEETGVQYPDSVVLRIYDKYGDGQAIEKVVSGIGGKIAVGIYATFHFHMRGSMGIGKNTGKPYAINDAFQCWKAESSTAQPMPQFGMQQQFAPQQQYAQQPQYQPQQQFAQPAAAAQPAMQQPFQYQPPYGQPYNQ